MSLNPRSQFGRAPAPPISVATLGGELRELHTVRFIARWKRILQGFVRPDATLGGKIEQGFLTTIDTSGIENDNGWDQQKCWKLALSR